ncbi:MAG: DUF934 domain-containing protein [Proteobacteria bacterium]|nr:DUF934 domain-containing protein [Pseudomonadota bacterium]
MPLYSQRESTSVLEPLTLDEWRQRPAWPAVALANTDDVEALAERVGALRLVVLHFPKFNDGRAYSQARLLRERLGYTGELRATGGVLQDQLPFLLRCGFDSFESEQKGFGEALGKASSLYSVVYQPTGDGRVTAGMSRLATRHRAAAE